MNESFRELVSRYQALQPRERQVLALGAVFVLATVIYLAVWQPLVALRADALDDLERARASAERLEILGAMMGSGARRGSGAIVARDQSLLSAVDQAGRNSPLGKPLTRIQPDGEDTVRVWLEAVPFDGLVRWVADLNQRYAIVVASAELEAKSAGQVDARLSLERQR